MKLILLKPWRLLFWLRLLSCLPVQNTNCSFRFLSYGPTHPSVLAQTQDLIHKVFLPSFPLQSVDTPGMVFLFPCLRLPYASCAEVPNDITKITLFAVNFGCSVRGPSDRSPLSWAVLWVYWSHLLSHCSHWEPSISCISVTVPSPSYQPTPSTLKHHWTGHQGCKSLQFLRCLFCCHRRFSAPAASPSPALSPPLSGKLQQVRAERGRAALWAGGEALAPQTQPQLPAQCPPTGPAWLFALSQFQSSAHSRSSSTGCAAVLSHPCSAAGGGWRGPPELCPLLGDTCAFQTGFGSLKPHGWQFQCWGSTASLGHLFLSQTNLSPFCLTDLAFSMDLPFSSPISTAGKPCPPSCRNCVFKGSLPCSFRNILARLVHMDFVGLKCFLCFYSFSRSILLSWSQQQFFYCTRNGPLFKMLHM